MIGIGKQSGWTLLHVLFSLGVASSDLNSVELNIMRPGWGELISDPAPEVEWNVMCPDSLLPGISVSVNLDGGFLTKIDGTEGQLALAGLSDGFHQIEASVSRSGKVLATASTRFLYLMPLDELGDDEEWQLSWVRSLAYRDRIKTLTSAIADMHAQHREELAQLKSDLVRSPSLLARPSGMSSASVSFTACYST
jgi:hypothetical protein